MNPRVTAARTSLSAVIRVAVRIRASLTRSCRVLIGFLPRQRREPLAKMPGCKPLDCRPPDSSGVADMRAPLFWPTDRSHRILPISVPGDELPDHVRPHRADLHELAALADA